MTSTDFNEKGTGGYSTMGLVYCCEVLLLECVRSNFGANRALRYWCALRTAAYVVPWCTINSCMLLLMPTTSTSCCVSLLSFSHQVLLYIQHIALKPTMSAHIVPVLMMLIKPARSSYMQRKRNRLIPLNCFGTPYRLVQA